MKLGKLGIFFILIISLLFSGLGFSTYELMTNRKEGYENTLIEPMETADEVNSYNDSPNQNNSTYDYVSNTPNSGSCDSNKPKGIPTSTAIPTDKDSSHPAPPPPPPKSPPKSPPNSHVTPPPPPPSHNNDDEYILKSQIVPPVCPKCPDAASCPRPKPCPPCAPCARCPEPAFECKKVPTYQGGPYPTMPKPVLNDFSQFGM
jgi:hypothetical protein